jgi:hypothetical protein
VRLAERHEPEEYKAARHCVEIWDAWKDRDGEGANYFREQVDAAMEAGDNIMVASPAFDLFPLLFVRAAAGWKGRPEPNHYTRLLGLIRRADAGEDLDRIAAEEEARGEEKRAAMKAAELAKPEPKDKTSAEWRYWKLRQIEYGFTSGDSEAYAAAWSFYRDLLAGLMEDENFFHVSFASTLLPHLIMARQEIAGWEDVTPPRPKGRKGKAAKKGAARK